MKVKRFPILLGLTLLLFVSACALLGSGDAAPPRARGYVLDVPKHWKAEVTKESDEAYRLPSGNLVTVNSSCTRNSGASLEVLTRHLQFGMRKVEIKRRERLSVAGTEGLFTEMDASIDKVPFHLNLFVFSKDGCVFDFSLLSPKPINDTESKEFVSFARSFHYGTRKT